MPEPSTAEQSDRALKVGNRLFHGFFERHNFNIQTDDDRDAMVADLEDMHDELFLAWRVADGIEQTLDDDLLASREPKGADFWVVGQFEI